MESSWFPVMEVRAQLQLRSAVAGKGFHFWLKELWLEWQESQEWQEYVSLWPVRNSLPKQLPTAGLEICLCSTGTAGTGSHPGEGALQGPDSLFSKGTIPRNADSQNMNAVLFNVQEGRRQISCILFPFCFRVLVSEYNADARARSRERTRDWRRTLMHSWENVPPCI